jgi:hypothetical protein
MASSTSSTHFKPQGSQLMMMNYTQLIIIIIIISLGQGTSLSGQLFTSNVHAQYIGSIAH